MMRKRATLLFFNLALCALFGWACVRDPEHKPAFQVDNLVSGREYKIINRQQDLYGTNLLFRQAWRGSGFSDTLVVKTFTDTVMLSALKYRHNGFVISKIPGQDYNGSGALIDKLEAKWIFEYNGDNGYRMFKELDENFVIVLRPED